MSPSASPVAPADPHAPPFADRVCSAWANVGVECVMVVPRANGLRVLAVIRLAGLAPADVRVELLPARDAGTDVGIDRRMWSCESYDNGRVVFERLIPLDEDTSDRAWMVRVHARDAPVERPVLYPLHLDAPACSSMRSEMPRAPEAPP